MNRALSTALRLACGVLALSLLATPAMADEPVVEVSRDGTVDGMVVVGAAPDEVTAYLTDVAALRRHSKDVVAVDVTRDGACELVTTTVRNMMEMTYTARRCPTATGWVETLLESEGMNDYYAEWFLTPVTGGVEVRFRLRTGVDLPIPARLLRGTIKANVRSGLERLLQLLGPPEQPAQIAQE